MGSGVAAGLRYLIHYRAIYGNSLMSVEFYEYPDEIPAGLGRGLIG